jgi:hypothetical protein
LPDDSSNMALPSSLLIVHLKMANDLPVIRKADGTYEPNPVALFTVGNQTIASSTRINTTNPNWVV